MADKKKVESEPESAETQKAPPAEEKTPAEEAEKKKTVSKDEKKPASEAESVWESLSGKTQDRIVQLVRKGKKLEQELAAEKARQLGQARVPAPPQKPTGAPSPEEIREAVTKLRSYGVATQEDLQAGFDRLYLDKEHDRLEGRFPGTDGRPKYVREEVEDYARTHGYGGNLEAAFRDMYRDELVDAEIKKRGVKKEKTYTEKPTASARVGEKPLTVASLRERLKQPDAAEWWAKNREKIEPHLDKLSRA